MKELDNWFPIGDDKFTIDYSHNYFNFFESIGSDGFHVTYKKDNIIGGSLCARYVRDAWYLCDLKIKSELRGKKITYKLFLRNFFFNYLKSDRGYAISMYPNPTVSKLNDNFKLMNMSNLGFIYIYLVDYTTMSKLYDILVKYYKHKYNGFVNINNMKKIIFKNGSEMRVLHFYHKNENHKSLIWDISEYSSYKFFFCLLEQDYTIMKNIIGDYYGLATLYARKMKIEEFSDLGTYEI